MDNLTTGIGYILLENFYIMGVLITMATVINTVIISCVIFKMITNVVDVEERKDNSIILLISTVLIGFTITFLYLNSVNITETNNREQEFEKYNAETNKDTIIKSNKIMGNRFQNTKVKNVRETKDGEVEVDIQIHHELKSTMIWENSGYVSDLITDKVSNMDNIKKLSITVYKGKDKDRVKKSLVEYSEKELELYKEGLRSVGKVYK